jgi:cyanophycinase
MVLRTKFDLPRARALVALLTAAAAGAPATAAEREPRGHLFIIGGGPRPVVLMERFVELAGGKGKAHIVVLPMASSEADASGQEQAEEFVALGAQARSLNLSREEAARDAAARGFDDATGIWFCGGDQSRVTAALKDTPVERAIRDRYLGGAAIGGTSAGAAVMSDPMITGDELRPGGDRPDTESAFLTIERDNVVTRPGLGLLPGTIVDQHFVRRKRHNRLLSLVLENPHLVGVGIDEATALEVAPGNRWRVLGAGVVVVYDARQGRVSRGGGHQLAAADVRLHVLPAGSAYDPRKRRVTLPR